MALFGCAVERGLLASVCRDHFGRCSVTRTPSLRSVRPMYLLPQLHENLYMQLDVLNGRMGSFGGRPPMGEHTNRMRGSATGKVAFTVERMRRTRIFEILSPMKGTRRKAELDSFSHVNWRLG